MRSFPLFFNYLVILLTVSSCSKGTIDAQIAGNWKLVSYADEGAIISRPPFPIPNLLILNRNQTYELRSGNALFSSGTYHIDHTIDPPQSILYFSDQGNGYGYQIGFSKDSLVLTYYGITAGWPATRKYVRN